MKRKVTKLSLYKKLGYASMSALALAVVGLASAEPIKRIQSPAISPDSSTIVFSWQNDLWKVARVGGLATRLSVHAAPDSRPIWFPDGSRIAFASSRYGNADIFTLKPDGTDLKRVTFDSSAETPTAVSADGRTIYGSSTQWSRGDLFKVRSTGGNLVRLTSHPFEATFLPTLSQDGSKVYYCRGAYRETAWQKPTMQSSALPEIWVADNTVPLSNHRRVTNNEATDMSPNMLPDGGMLFISNRNGWPNIWRSGSGERALTTHKDGTVRNLTSSRDGRFATYEFESELMVLDLLAGTSTKVTVDVPADDRTNPVQDLAVRTGVDGFSVAPDGKRLIISARGDLFLLPEKGGTTRRLTASTNSESSPVWIDSKTAVYVSMEGGRRRLKTVGVDGSMKDFVVDPGKDLVGPSLSPDGQQLAFHRGGDEICVTDLTGKTIKTVLKGNFMDAFESGALYTWSPDSKWLAVSNIVGRRTDILLVNVLSGKQIIVAKMVNRPQRGSVSPPKFLPNGKAVFFSSPEYDESDLYIVDLVPAEITYTEDDLDKLDEAPKKEKPPISVEVYEPNLQSRIRRLTTTGVGSVEAASDSKSIYAITRMGLQSIAVTTGTAQTLIATAPGFGLTGLSFTNGKLYAGNGGGLAVVNLAGPATAVTPINFVANYSVNLKAEEVSLFEEIWWAMDRLYYDPGMNGKNWSAIRMKFEALVPYAYDRTDFYRMMGEMMEELDSSHLGATAPPVDFAGTGTDATGFLGVDFKPEALANEGTLIVASVVPNSPADQPGSLLKVGDRILKIDGQSADDAPVAVLLNKKVGRKVILSVTRDNQTMDITIKPASLASRSALEYDAWVSANRALVSKLSEGRLAYVHIRAMDKVSLDQFLREIRTEGEGRKGLLIDVRFNGGGSTAVDVLGVLIRTPWLMRTTRGEFGLKLSENIFRGDALELPTALMINTFSFSNAEVIAEGFRKLKLGPIVGERTPGYVIGTGGFGLWDGGLIRMPSIGAYAVNGENLENNGRKPDHSVWFDPNAWQQGRDLQLERAVLELLKTAK